MVPLDRISHHSLSHHCALAIARNCSLRLSSIRATVGILTTVLLLDWLPLHIDHIFIFFSHPIEKSKFTLAYAPSLSQGPLSFPCQQHARFRQGQQRVTLLTSPLSSLRNCYRTHRIRATGRSQRGSPTALSVGTVECREREGRRAIRSTTSLLPTWDERPWLHTFK